MHGWGVFGTQSLRRARLDWPVKETVLVPTGRRGDSEETTIHLRREVVEIRPVLFQQMGTTVR